MPSYDHRDDSIHRQACILIHTKEGFLSLRPYTWTSISFQSLES